MVAELENKQAVADEIDWKIVDQLHDATSRISNDCFEYKKLCIAVVAAVVALMVKFGSTENFTNAMILCAICCTGFWISDSTAYFYQRKLRNQMKKRISNISERHSIVFKKNNISFGWWNSFFNPSMALYHILLISIFLFWKYLPSA